MRNCIEVLCEGLYLCLYLYQAILYPPSLLETPHFYPLLIVQSELLSFVHAYIYCKYKGKSTGNQKPT